MSRLIVRGTALLLALAPPVLALVLLGCGLPESQTEPMRPPPVAAASAQSAPISLSARLSRDENQRLLSAVGWMVVSGQLQIVLPADGRSLKAEARFSYDPKRRELRPTNDSARDLLDIRRGLPKS